jgi:hypothetical protein
MSAIILMNVDDEELASILVDEYGDNRVFESVEKADSWLQENAKVGWCTRIIDLDN